MSVYSAFSIQCFVGTRTGAVTVTVQQNCTDSCASVNDASACTNVYNGKCYVRI